MKISSNIKVMEVDIRSTDYPELLKYSPHPPSKLYYIGDISLINQSKTISVVGSRQMSEYGRRCTEKLAESCFASGVSIVSGFAVGVDITTHLELLKHVKTHNRGSTQIDSRSVDKVSKSSPHDKEVVQTVEPDCDQQVRSIPIIVLPCGINHITPVSHEEYFFDLVNHGAIVITEYESSHPPFKWTYPRRNRIIAAISNTTVIVEAKPNGGSMNTAEYARNLKRDILCFPGRIFDSQSEGTNQLIRDGYAKAICSVNDLLESIGVNQPTLSLNNYQPNNLLNDLQNQVVKSVYYNPADVDSLIRSIKAPPAQVLVEISNLELLNYIVQKGGKYYAN